MTSKHKKKIGNHTNNVDVKAEDERNGQDCQVIAAIAHQLLKDPACPKGGFN